MNETNPAMKPRSAPMSKKVPKLIRPTVLGSEESFLWEGRPSGFIYFPLPVFILIVVLAFNVYLWARVSHSPLSSLIPIIPYFPSMLIPHTIDSIPIIMGILLLLFAIIFFAIRWFKRAYTVYALTNTRFIRQKGIFSRDFDEIEIRQIRGIDVNQTVFQRLLRYGTVTLSAVSGSPNSIGNEKLIGFPQPAMLQRLMEDAQEKLEGLVRNS